MFVTRHSNITDLVLGDKLWTLYELAYRGMAEQAVTREMLYRTEFDEAIADSTNRIWVVWDDQTPVGMALIATDVGSTRYISRAYFEHHYPEHMRRDAVHYLMWIVVHPAYEARGAIIRMAREGLALEAADGVLLVFDVPEKNQPRDSGGLAEMMLRLARMLGTDAPVRKLETQRYYAVDFAPQPAPVAEDESAQQPASTRAPL